LIAVSRLHYPVTALGYGIRAGIWVQGCTIACNGCVSKDTWVAGPEHIMEIDEIRNWLDQTLEPGIDGITISGGEPFEQPLPLLELVEMINEWRASSKTPIDILCYSGMTSKRLVRDHSQILESGIDAIIAEPFIQTQPTDLIWRGSANQKLMTLSKLGRDRYDPYQELAPTRPPMQVSVDQGSIWCIGIPRRGDMEQLKSRLASSGVLIHGESW